LSKCCSTANRAVDVTVIPAKAGIQFVHLIVFLRVVRNPCVYILASQRNGTLYVGVTSDLVKRVYEHKNELVEGFTRKYGVHTRVWFEQRATMESAITREKQIKKWNRDWKFQLIEESNSAWRDLYEDIV